jgi:hypothetical protein
MSMEIYQAGPIKRYRATKAEVEERRAALHDIVAGMRPMTVRQVFYQATVRGLIEKSEAGYSKVQTDLVLMRKSGELPYGWLAGNTRWQRRPRTFSDVESALEETARFYRKSLWDSADSYVTPRQVGWWNLPSRPTKASDTRSKAFEDVSVELDAIQPATLRNLVEGAIQKHLPHHEFEVLKAAEESEREILLDLVAGLEERQ